MGEKTIVIDTNILVSAAGWGGKPDQAILKAQQEGYRLILAQRQLEEIYRVIGYPRLEISEEQKSRLLSLLSAWAHIVDTDGDIRAIAEDPSDDVLLEAAVENGARYIITGDKHLLALREYRSVKIVTAEGFLRV